MENIFEQASRLKLRFSGLRGSLTTEDLWDLSLEDLDTIAKGVNKKVEESSEKSFIKKRTTGDKKMTLALAVVVSIIDTKMTEAAMRKVAADRKAKRDQIIQLISEKENGALAKKSLTSLKAELDKIDTEEEELLSE